MMALSIVTKTPRPRYERKVLTGMGLRILSLG